MILDFDGGLAAASGMAWPSGGTDMKSVLATGEAMKHLGEVEGLTHALDADELLRLQKTLVAILADVDRVCRANGIRYFLGGGTALGAVRHRGPIPWDDDMDINMSRADFDAFVPAFRKACGERYWVHSPNDDDTHGLVMARVRLKGTSVRDRNDVNETECGAYTDIFIFENVPDNAALRLLHGLGSLALGLLVSVRKFWRDRKGLLALTATSPSARRTTRTKVALGFFVAWLPMDFCVHLANGWNRLCRNCSSKRVTCPAGRLHYFGETGLRADLCETREAVFAGVNALISANAESYLARLYGPDYMTPPAERGRERHLFLRPFEL